MRILHIPTAMEFHWTGNPDNPNRYITYSSMPDDSYIVVKRDSDNTLVATGYKSKFIEALERKIPRLESSSCDLESNCFCALKHEFIVIESDFLEDMSRIRRGISDEGFTHSNRY